MISMSANVTLFLYRVGMLKLFCSFGFISTFYATFYFVKGPIKTEHDTLECDWLTAEFLLILHFCEAILIIVQVNRF